MENIKIAINSNCELIATPPEFITSQDSYYLEFIYNPSINPEDTMKISNNRDYYQQELCEDGLYVYHFIEMPAKHALISPDEYPDLYYDEDSGEIMMFLSVTYTLQVSFVTSLDSRCPRLSVTHRIHSTSLLNMVQTQCVSVCFSAAQQETTSFTMSHRSSRDVTSTIRYGMHSVS